MPSSDGPLPPRFPVRFSVAATAPARSLSFRRRPCGRWLLCSVERRCSRRRHRDPHHRRFPDPLAARRRDLAPTGKGRAPRNGPRPHGDAHNSRPALRPSIPARKALLAIEPKTPLEQRPHAGRIARPNCTSQWIADPPIGCQTVRPISDVVASAGPGAGGADGGCVTATASGPKGRMAGGWHTVPFVDNNRERLPNGMPRKNPEQ